MTITTKDWTYNDFRAFILMFAAHSDFKVTEKEKEIMGTDLDPARVAELDLIFNHQSDYENIQTILSFKDRFFATNEQKEKLFDDIRQLYCADDKFCPAEKAVMAVLKRLM